MRSPSEISGDKVAVYVRWSTDDQTEGTTLEIQLERCKHFLKSQGWSFNEHLVYIDDGWSGGSLDRPALTRLRADVAVGKVECAVVYRIDRLSRSVVDIVELVLREWEGRCYVKSTSEDVNTISPAGKMFFYILVSFAEYERNIIRERTMSGKVKRAEQGLNPGFRPPFGYVTGEKPGTVRAVEHEAAVVVRIFEMHLRGNGSYQISQTLNHEGWSHRGKLWNDLAVRRILRNPAYVGILEYGKTSRTSRDQRQRHGLGHVIRFDQPRFARVEGAYPAFISAQMWEEARNLTRVRSFTDRQITSKPTYSKYLLSGLARCRCGAPINGKGVGGDHYYYYCTARKRRGRSVCDAGHIRTDQINAEIEERVKAVLLSLGKRSLGRMLEDDLNRRSQEVAGALRTERTAMSALADREQRLERDYRSGELAPKLYSGELEAAATDRETITQRIHALEVQRGELTLARSQSDRLLGKEDLIGTWDQLNVPERKLLLQRLTASLVVYRPVRSAQPPMLEINWIKLHNGGQQDIPAEDWLSSYNTNGHQ